MFGASRSKLLTLNLDAELEGCTDQREDNQTNWKKCIVVIFYLEKFIYFFFNKENSNNFY